MDEKKKLIARIEEIKGRLPSNPIELLNVLAHPDVVALAKAYIQVNDKTEACTKHIAPWTCIKEYEAYYMNLEQGSVGAANRLENEDSWCPACYNRVMDGEIGRRPSDHSDEMRLALQVLHEGERGWSG